MEFLINTRRLIGHVLFWYTFALLLGTHLPRDAIVDLNERDKAVHFVAYLGLSLLSFAYRTARIRSWHSNCLTLAFVLVIFATVDESTQRFSPGRLSTVSDWVANCCGISFGTIVWALLKRRQASVNLSLIHI